VPTPSGTWGGIDKFTDFHIFTLSGGKKVAPFYL